MKIQINKLTEAKIFEINLKITFTCGFQLNIITFLATVEEESCQISYG